MLTPKDYEKLNQFYEENEVFTENVNYFLL